MPELWNDRTSFKDWNRIRFGRVKCCCRLSDRDMGARHRARAHSIQIMKVQVIAANKCRRPAIKQFHVSLHRFLFPVLLLLWRVSLWTDVHHCQLQFNNPTDKKPDSSSRFPASIFKPGGFETGDRRFNTWKVCNMFALFLCIKPSCISSCRTPRSSSRCLTGSCAASTNPVSPPRDQTPSSKSIFSYCAGKNKTAIIGKKSFLSWFVDFKFTFEFLLNYNELKTVFWLFLPTYKNDTT